MTIDLGALKTKAVGGKPAKEPIGCALVMFYGEDRLMPFGSGWLLAYDGDQALIDFIDDGGATKEGCALGHTGIDYDPGAVKEDGVYIGELRFQDDGPGDWPGTREVMVQLWNIRKATPEEWAAHLAGEWPWDPAQFDHQQEGTPADGEAGGP